MVDRPQRDQVRQYNVKFKKQKTNIDTISRDEGIEQYGVAKNVKDGSTIRSLS